MTRARNETQSVVIVRSGIPDPMFHVHAETCTDLSRRRYYARDAYTLAAPSRRAVVEYMYSDQIAESGSTWTDGYVQDFKFFPCVALDAE